MKKIVKFLFVISLFLFSHSLFAEEIKNYDLDIQLHRDASMTITENIDYDFGDVQKHGIFRFIPVNFEVEGQKKWYGLKQRKLLFKNLSVQRDGVDEVYTKEEKDGKGNYFIKIGKADETISGLYHYTLQYDVLGSLRYFKDYDELYWNAIGLDWKVPIKNAEVRIQSDDIPFQNFSCYAGPLHSQKKCSSEKKEGDSLIFKQDSLQAGEGISVAVSFGKGLVSRVEYFHFTPKAFVLGVVSLLIFSVGGLWYGIRKYQRKYFVYDPVHPRYTPPENFDAIFTGYLIDRKLDSRDISAGIIQLARDGYIEIEKRENKSFFGNSNDYIFTLKKNIEDEGPDTSKVKKFILQLLFSDTQNIALILKSLSSNNFDEDNFEVGKQNTLSEIAKRNDRTQYSFIENILKDYFVKEHFFEEKNQKNNWYVLIPFVLTLLFFFSGNAVLGFVMFFITFVSIFMMASMKMRYTKKGWETKHAIEGFKLFLAMTEKERYEFFNNPADNPQEFMEYLPYAIALGVEKKWAQQFKSITIPQPNWYKGSGPFVATAFADEMSSFAQHISSSVATKASSGSGSSGGGFSGGGSGGGGGGSW